MLSPRRFIGLSRLPIFMRNISTQQNKYIQVDIDNDGFAHMKLNRPPVNSLNMETFQEMSRSLDDIVNNEHCRGLVMSSALPKVFSAGLDLNELYQPKEERLKVLWESMQDVYIKIYGSGISSAIAIHCFAAAGAFVLSLMCDYRVMVNNGSVMGLNDTAVGVVPSKWIIDMFINIVGYRKAELAIGASTMFNAEDAFKINLVDELATDQQDAINKSKAILSRYNNISPEILKRTKKVFREDKIKYLLQNREKDTEIFINNIMNPLAQTQIGKFVHQLKKKKASTA